MTDTQENQISMLYKVDLFLDNNLSELSTVIPILSVHAAAFKDKLNELGSYEQEATENISGYALQKLNVRNQMRDYALVVSGGVVAYALQSGEDVLAGKARLTKSTLDNIRDADVLYKCEKLLSVCSPILTALIPYGVSAPKHATFSNLVTTYKQILQNPADQRSEGSAYGNKVDKTLDEIFVILLILDGLMETVAISHDVLYMHYKLNRMIDDNASGPGTPPTVTVTILPGTFLLALTLLYLAGRSFKARNLNADAVNWCLSTSDSAFTNPPKVLDAGATSTLLSSTLAPDGDKLLFQNTSTNPVTIEVTVME